LIRRAAARVLISVLSLATPGAFAAAAAPAPNAGQPGLDATQQTPSDEPAHDSTHHHHSMASTEAMAPMNSALGPYPMAREGSGTSWQPESTPMEGLHVMKDEWSLMAHGFVNVIRDGQTGPRGDRKLFTESMAMLMAHRPVGAGTLGLRAMASLDPTMGRSGYPLLLQTGETADGRTPLVDRQHPHDLFMELAASYSVPLGDGGSAFAYFGLPGEPALGPSTFMHRFSGMRNPEAPLTHHWLDSTHITFGVATLGASQGPVQIEGSWFNGREPDQRRWNIETRSFDSWSGRLSYNPAPELAMQVSYGDLRRPEQLEPETRVRRTTASATYHRRLGADQWATTLAYGRNRKSGPDTNVAEPGWLLESTYVLGDTHTVFGRAEQVKNSELFGHGDPLHGQAFRIRKYSVGYIYDFAKAGAVKWGVGALVGFLDAPTRLDAVYGSNPRSYMVFLQGRL
jgi:hypothetical protein